MNIFTSLPRSFSLFIKPTTIVSLCKPTVSRGFFDKIKQNLPSIVEKGPSEQNKSLLDVTKQAVNRDRTWSKGQRSRREAMVGPRFENTDIRAQPNPPAAIELINQEPTHYVEGRIAACHGGGGALGHPRVFINLDQPGSHACGYCGIRFEQKSHHH